MESEIPDYLSARLEALFDCDTDTGYFRTGGFHDRDKSLQSTTVRKEIIDNQYFIFWM